jgi:predicted Rdx family selenoprotein
MEKELAEQAYIVYNFKWKELKGEWQEQEVIGHKFYEDVNRMVLYKKDGGIFEIPCWNDHYSNLGKDWADKVKEQIKEEEKTKEESSGNT